jgi:hypothetical protein
MIRLMSVLNNHKKYTSKRFYYVFNQSLPGGRAGPVWEVSES